MSDWSSDVCSSDLRPHVMIAEITRGNFDLGQLRLCGHEIARWFRDMPEGMSARDFAALTDAAYMRYMRDLLAELIQRRRPLYCQSVYTLPPEPGAATAPAAVAGTDRKSTRLNSSH